MADLRKWSQDEISRMRRDMDRLFDELCSDFDLPVMYCRMAGDLDLKEDGDTLVARFELGNISPDHVQVSVLDRRLIISAKMSAVEGGVKQTQTFRKEVRLPCVIRTDEVKANFHDGKLEVRLPRCPRQNGQTVKIVQK